MKLGDKITQQLGFGLGDSGKKISAAGKVVYIHPRGRYYTLEFTFEYGKFRESFPME